MDDFIPKLSNREWLSKFFLRTHSKPLIVGLSVAIINLIVNYSIAAYTNTLKTNSSGIGLLDDYTTWAFALLFQPALFGTYCWLQSAGGNLFGQLVNEGAFETKKEFNDTIQKLQKRMGNRFLPILAFLLAIAQSALSLLIAPQLNLMWLGTYPIQSWLRLPIDFLMFYIIVIGIYDFIVILVAINEIFKLQKVNLQPYHPDKAGGVGAVGRFMANIGYSIAPVAVTVVLLSLQLPNMPASLAKSVITLIPVIYLIMAPICFILPVWSTHSAMVTYRDQQIKKISDEFNNTYGKIMGAKTREPDEIEPLLKKIRQLDEERKIVEQFPVWPFNSTSVRKYFGLAFSPFLPVITSYIIDFVSRLL